MSTGNVGVGSCVPKQERGFDVQNSRIKDALSGLDSAVSELIEAFGPTLKPEAPQGVGEINKACENRSEYVSAMDGFVSSIQDATSRIRYICGRSEI